MPLFYSRIITSKDCYCFNQFDDIIAYTVLFLTGFCKNMDYYNFRKDEKGSPLIEDCIKNTFTDYY